MSSIPSSIYVIAVVAFAIAGPSASAHPGLDHGFGTFALHADHMQPIGALVLGILTVAAGLGCRWLFWQGRGRGC